MKGRHDGSLKRAAELRRKMPPRAVIRGKSGCIISVKTPNPMFSEAIFILRDDIFAGRELSREDILRQARVAAGDYTASVAPPYPTWQIVLFSVLSGLLPGIVIGLII